MIDIMSPKEKSKFAHRLSFFIEMEFTVYKNPKKSYTIISDILSCIDCTEISLYWYIRGIKRLSKGQYTSKKNLRRIGKNICNKLSERFSGNNKNDLYFSIFQLISFSNELLKDNIVMERLHFLTRNFCRNAVNIDSCYEFARNNYKKLNYATLEL